MMKVVYNTGDCKRNRTINITPSKPQILLPLRFIAMYSYSNAETRRRRKWNKYGIKNLNLKWQETNQIKSLTPGSG